MTSRIRSNCTSETSWFDTLSEICTASCLVLCPAGTHSLKRSRAKQWGRSAEGFGVRFGLYRAGVAVDGLLVTGRGAPKRDVSALLRFSELFVDDEFFFGPANSRSFCSLLPDEFPIDELCGGSRVAPVMQEA